MRLVAVAVAAALATPAAAQMVTLSPEQIGEIFCLSRLGNDMAPVQGLLTPDLAAAIAEAEAKDAAWATANPGDKPPLGDGIPWQAFPDYADTCTPGQVTLMMDEAAVAIDYAFTAYPDASFTDFLQLKLLDDPMTEARVWRIDNVAYSTDGDLRTSLLSVFMN